MSPSESGNAASTSSEGGVRESRGASDDPAVLGNAQPALRNAASTSRSKRKYWSCPKCGTRLRRTRQKCDCGRKRPAKRRPKHELSLWGDTYDSLYVTVARQAHGISDESCCVCGRPRHESMRHHRDHDHVTGNPRGIVCFQCNRLMPRLLTLERSRAITAYLERVEEHYAS